VRQIAASATVKGEWMTLVLSLMAGNSLGNSSLDKSWAVTDRLSLVTDGFHLAVTYWSGQGDRLSMTRRD